MLAISANGVKNHISYTTHPSFSFFSPLTTAPLLVQPPYLMWLTKGPGIAIGGAAFKVIRAFEKCG